MLAAGNGSEDILKLLLDGGADVNALDNTKKSTLMFACAKGHSALAGLLLRAGADAGAGVNACDKVRVVAFAWA